MGGFSTILQLLSMAGFVLAIIGVAVIVSAVSREQSWRGGGFLTLIGALIGILFMIVGSGLLEVGATQVAVIYNTVSGQVEAPRRSGIHVILPGVQQVTMYPINQQEYTMSGLADEGARSGDDAVEARSIDGQTVEMDVTILFRIKNTDESIRVVHLDWAGDEEAYREQLIRPTVRSVVRDVVSTFQAEEIYGARRTEMQAMIEEALREDLDPRGFELNGVLVRNITFSAEFTQAIEGKQVEEQELQRARTAAERAREEAKGRADAAIEAARGEAEATLVRAQADAEALRLVSQQIAANPNLLQYIYITTLSDNVSLALIPSNTPFLFDSSTFTQLAPDFVPPTVPEREGETGSGN
jgi:regulator of protease activity HflC (stomatin/prohibitin superfamily)